MSDCPAGKGIVKRLGWQKVRGKDVFRAVIDFPNGPPELSPGVIWDSIPVSVVPCEPTPAPPAFSNDALERAAAALWAKENPNKSVFACHAAEKERYRERARNGERA